MSSTRAELGGYASVLEGSDDEGLVTATDSEALLRQIISKEWTAAGSV